MPSIIGLIVASSLFMIVAYKLNVITSYLPSTYLPKVAISSIITVTKKSKSNIINSNINDNPSKFISKKDSKLSNIHIDIHSLLTFELYNMLISGFISSGSAHLSSDIISLIQLYYNIKYTEIFIIKGSHKGKHPSLNKIEFVNLNYKKTFNINIYHINDELCEFEQEINNNNNTKVIDNNPDHCNYHNFVINNLHNNRNGTEINQRNQMNAYDIQNDLSTNDSEWDTEENGICYVSNINPQLLIPNDIINKINLMNDKYINNNNNDKYNTIFKCAGMTALGSNISLNSNASMIIFRDNCNYNYILSNEVTQLPVSGYEIDLPDLPRAKAWCAQTTYSHQHGLITNCRENTYILDLKNYVIEYNINSEELEFESRSELSDRDADHDHEEDCNDNYWNKLPQMNIMRNWAASLCIIDSDISNESLFICGGDGSNRTTEIYNFNDNIWYRMKNMNHSTMQSGIYYDKLSSLIYIGGGYETEKNINYYDIYKDKWIKLKNTNFPHKEYPSIWCNHLLNNKILYICGNQRNDLGVIEFIDLRINNNKWNLAPNNMQLNQYIQTPQLFKHNIHTRRDTNHSIMQIRRTFI